MDQVADQVVVLKAHQEEEDLKVDDQQVAARVAHQVAHQVEEVEEWLLLLYHN